MKETWRWFGPDDPINLEKIVQAGATGIVSALHEIETGEIWPVEKIKARKTFIESAGLRWSVIESLPVHNDIKSRTRNYVQLIENYKQSLRNIAEAGLQTICYNFMPVVDWTRTNLSYELPNKTQALRFDMTDFVAYDVYMLKRDGAEQNYSKELLNIAETKYSALTAAEKQALEQNIIAGLPGGEGSYSRQEIIEEITHFNKLGTEGFRNNYFQFLKEIIPLAEDLGLKMCVHPDDPPFSLFGLPRVVSTSEDVRNLLNAYPSDANGLTLCAGSFGARGDNNLVEMAEEFADKIYFVHLRNVKREGDGSFIESDHLDGDNDIFSLVQSLLREEQRRARTGIPSEISMRPDHGHLMADEQDQENVKPGYSYIGRLKGLAELRGVIYSVSCVL